MIIIDTSHLLSRAVFANRDQVVQEPFFASHSLLNTVLYFSRKFGASKENPVILAMDAKPYWRTKYYAENKDRFADYKGNPKYENYKGHRVKDETIPWEKIYDTYHDIIGQLELHSDFFVMSVEGAEADDVIAVLANKCKAENKKSVIVSSDKDFKQLNDPPLVNIFDPIKNIFIPSLDVELYKKIHALTGDSGDNILPVRARVGPKTAEKMIPDLDITLQLDSDLRERYEFNRTLTDFDRIPIDISEKIITSLDGQCYNYNMMNLLKSFSKYRLAQLTEKVQEFKLKETGILNEDMLTVTQVESIKEGETTNLEEFFS